MASARRQLEKKIDAQRRDVEELRQKVTMAESYLRGLEEGLKFLPEESKAAQITRESLSLRHGTDLAKAREAIVRVGKPLHINELLSAIGKEVNKKNRISLGGNIASYVRDGKVFTRVAPATFGLLEMNKIADENPATDVSEDQGEQRPALAVVR